MKNPLIGIYLSTMYGTYELISRCYVAMVILWSIFSDFPTGPQFIRYYPVIQPIPRFTGCLEQLTYQVSHGITSVYLKLRKPQVQWKINVSFLFARNRAKFYRFTATPIDPVFGEANQQLRTFRVLLWVLLWNCRGMDFSTLPKPWKVSKMQV